MKPFLRLPPARLLLLAALAAALPAPSPWAQSAPPATANGSNAVRLPALGDTASDDISVGSERRLGNQIMAEVRRDPAYLDDPLLLDYLQLLWQPLVAAARARGHIGPDVDTAFAWESFLVRDRSVNAFALPGGFVGVHLGLMAMTATPDELASVLAHELSHVTQRHIARSIASANRQSMVGMAAMLLGVLAASRAGSPDMAQAAVVGSQAAMAQGQLNFSRDMEREADRIGWGVYADAGFAPAGVAVMFERLDQANRLDSGAYPYLRSHPLTVDRIGEARSRVEAAGGARLPPTPPLMHMLMQARARALMDTGVQALRRAQGSDLTPLADGPERVAALYASAVASLELREPARAQAALDQGAALARRVAPGDRGAAFAFALLQAQAWQASAQAPRALELLDAQRGSLPPALARAFLMARAQAALDTGRGGAAATAVRPSAEALQTWVAERRGDALAWTLLAQANEQLGLKLRSLRAQAEAQAALGDLQGAIDRLRAGQREARSGAAPDFVEASVIDARLRDLTAQRRALLPPGRGARGDGREGKDGGDERPPWVAR
ncbi:MAG TPA: M48 family metalloprotease [Burkholderiaceae bacterium]|nr:M48 family metalloprotease [Burkholderiaceae bacterium]